jgi:hypothetical protein
MRLTAAVIDPLGLKHIFADLINGQGAFVQQGLYNGKI